MPYKRILTIQDISCVGQCSMTVALPILSALGHETCILPTALLSTHTGGFGRPAVVHFDEALADFRRHWQENDITFDAILVGYLGSIGAVEAAAEILDTMLAPGGIAIVDPAMGDHGRLYTGFDEGYARAVEKLCRKADILLPNLTEAAILSSLPYSEHPDAQEIARLLDRPGKTVLTGVGFREGETGVMIASRGQLRHYAHHRFGKSYHGTGDIFAAVFTGTLLREEASTDEAIYRAAKAAADFVCRAIALTEQDPAHWYGVKFEPLLRELWRDEQD